jgi:hypothetical protein
MVDKAYAEILNANKIVGFTDFGEGFYSNKP